MLQSVDISHWNGKIDWAKMAAQKATGALDFVIIRAGSIDASGPYTDYQFEANVAGADDNNIPYAFYWFFRPNYDSKVQADYFKNLAYNNYHRAPAVDLWCDIEVAGDAAKVLEFCNYCKQASATGIYTNPNTVLYKLTGNKTPLAEFPLWLADWTPPANVPAPWHEYLIWQYAVKQDGAAYGCASAGLDHNQALDSFLSVTPAPVPSDLEARVKALEDKTVESGGAIDNLAYMMAVAGQRLTTLESFKSRIEQLEIITARNEKDLDNYVTELVALTKRVTLLESRAPTTISAPFKMLMRTPARCITGYNATGKPVFQIYPKDTSPTAERIYLENTVDVFPYAMTGDGGRKAYPVYKPAPVQLYVYAEDGQLQ